jgi:hypothetical protein
MFDTKKNAFLQQLLANTFFSNSVCLIIFFKWKFSYWRQIVSEELLFMSLPKQSIDQYKIKVLVFSMILKY